MRTLGARRISCAGRLSPALLGDRPGRRGRARARRPSRPRPDENVRAGSRRCRPAGTSFELRICRPKASSMSWPSSPLPTKTCCGCACRSIARNHFLAHFRLEERAAAPHAGRRRLGAAERAGALPLRAHRDGAVSSQPRRGAASTFSAATASASCWSGLNYLWRLTRPGSIAISRGSAAAKGEAPYETWIRIFDEAPERDRARHAERLASLAQRPLISILLAVPSVEGAGRSSRAAIAGQIYPDWELVVAAPADRQGEVRRRARGARSRSHAKLRIVNAGDRATSTPRSRWRRASSCCRSRLRCPLRPHALLELAMTIGRVPARGRDLRRRGPDRCGRAAQRLALQAGVVAALAADDELSRPPHAAAPRGGPRHRRLAPGVARGAARSCCCV